jgi:hypothetical protein
LVRLLRVVDDEGTSLVEQFLIHFIVIFHLEDDREIFFHNLASFAKVRNAVADLVDDVAESGHSYVSKGSIPKICTSTTTPTSTGF